jgi:beta-galactosidase
LYRDVNIIALPDTHFDLESFGCPGIHVTPVMEGKNAKVTIKSFITDLKDGDKIQYRILNAEGNIVSEQTDKNDFAMFSLLAPHYLNLWNETEDDLYLASARIIDYCISWAY